jgi:D-alanine-D-alanine ligase
MTKRILVLMHQGLVPPESVNESDINWEFCEWATEYDVVTALRKLGYEVLPIGMMGDLKAFRAIVDNFKPHIVFNLMEMFDGEVTFDQNVVSYLQMLKIPFTGCNPRGLMIARDKALTKKILNYHRIRCPKFHVFPKNKKTKLAKHLSFPLIVKCLNEEASYGISQASVVHSEEKLMERVQFIQTQLLDDAIVEEFIAGKEYYCGVMGNYQLKVLPVWELHFDKSENPDKEFYTRSAKFNEKYRDKKGIWTGRAQVSKELDDKIQKACKKTYKVLNLSGYARVDLRVDENEEVYVIEANPNPDISSRDDFASSALHQKVKYPDLIKKIVSLGLAWHTQY